jgi:ribonuclease R
MSPHKKSGGLRPVSKKRIVGIMQITRRGVGYVSWDTDKEDIEIRTEDLSGALNGDTVEVELDSLYPRPKGKVVSIASRAKEVFVATLQKKAGVLLAIPDDKKFYRPITLSTIPPYDEGEKVLVHLISFTGIEDPVGTVIEHLGRAGEHRVEMNAIVLAHGFRTEFPEDVAREARDMEQNHAQIIKDEAPKRADYRAVTTFTIDPVDAKDFDDALSIKELKNGELEIGIHIADVTFFVRPDTPLGHEAQKRGTSVYLVDTTIPMLPNELSGNVCSLKEGEDRLTFSAVFTMNRNGQVLERRFEKSIICSNKRFTYEEAQEVLNKGHGSLVQELGTLRALARILRTKREKEGAIDFGDNEVKFVLDKDGKPLGVVRKERLETMQLIEEFMLLANKEVAQYISKLAQKIPESRAVFLYRIHDAPKEDRIEELATFVRAIGFEFGLAQKATAGGSEKKKKYTARDIAHLLKQIEGKPEEHLIRTATLRSMAKAIYSTKNIGHFGLSFQYYTHFTSPIRRYPDMLAHRILASHLNGTPLTQKEFGDLEKLCIAASAREAEAVEAERESIRYKQVEYMGTKIGQIFEAVISGVTDWGLYVEEKESASEGLVPVRTIGDDFYSYNQKEYSLVGQRTKKKYALGDRVRVKLVAADLAARTLDFALVK